MSCLPGTPCYTVTTTSGCSSDPCYPTTTNSNLICYTGPNLSCTGINNGDSLTVSLQKIDNTVCEVNEVITASNGLYKNGSDIRLGGELTEDTTIVASTNTLSITGLYIDTDPHYLLTESVLGVVRVSTPQTILDKITANNGITKTINNFQLGGVLTKNTSIPLAGFTFSLRDASTGTGLLVTPSTDQNQIYGNFGVDKFSYLANNVGIRTSPDNNTHTGGNQNTSLKVEKAGIFTNTSFEATVDNVLYMGTAGAEAATGLYGASLDRLYWDVNSDQTLRPGTAIAASIAYLQYVSPNNTTGGNMSASAAQAYFSGDGSLDKVIGYRALSPVEDAISGYAGTIDEVVGVQIEDQKQYIDLNITDSYGIKQLGANDRNLFNGTFVMPSTNTSVGTATLVNGTVVVNTVSARTGSFIFVSRESSIGTPGDLLASKAGIVDGVSFQIFSGSPSDNSTVNWWIVNV